MAEVFRDALGIPHIRATDAVSLAFAQGEVTARDRGWQIEVDRLRAHGRLAELIGEGGVAWDVFARRARLDDTARAAFAALDDDTRAFVAAYAAGVRQGLRESQRPAEFDELDRVFGAGWIAPEWEDHDPLGVLHVAHALFSPFPVVLWREHVAETLGDAWVEVFAGYAAEDAGEDAAGVAGVALGGLASGDDLADDTLPSSGSNGWALHGSRTAHGLPIIAGDPHRIFELPGVYQQVRLACDEFDVVGLAFPGVPGVPHFGHTGTAAWGVTNAIAHSVDVFRESLRRTDAGFAALGPDGWTAADVERSTIVVRGGEPVAVEAIETERGTVVTEVRPGADAGELTAWSVRMPARVGHDLGAATLPALLRARTAEDVIAAFDSWVDPVNRVLAADSSGTVLSATVGRAPARSAAERRLPLDGRAVRPVGVIDFPPAIEVTDVAVDANERPGSAEPVSSRRFAPRSTTEWEARSSSEHTPTPRSSSEHTPTARSLSERSETKRPDPVGIDAGWAYPSAHRARRIRHLLDELRPRSVDEFAPIWGDTLSGSALALRDFLPTGELPAAPAAVRDALRAWDGRMDADSSAAGLFAAWRTALVQRVRAHPSLAPLDAPHGRGAVLDLWFGITAHVAAALPVLLRHPAIAADSAAIVAAALADASDAGPWGERHRMLPLHVLADVPGAVVPGAGLDAPLSGDSDAVRCTGSTPGVTDRSWRGSVARWAWDLADREQSLWSVPFGAAGGERSAHFGDQQPGWVDVTPARVVTDWAALTPDEPTGEASVHTAR